MALRCVLLCRVDVLLRRVDVLLCRIHVQLLFILAPECCVEGLVLLCIHALLLCCLAAFAALRSPRVAAVLKLRTSDAVIYRYLRISTLMPPPSSFAHALNSRIHPALPCNGSLTCAPSGSPIRPPFACLCS